MLCIYCKYPESHVVYTRQNEVNNTVKRRRECIKCGGRYTTFEALRPEKVKESEHKT